MAWSRLSADYDNGDVVPAIVVERSSSASMNQQRSRRHTDARRRCRVIEHVAQLPGRQLDSEEDAADISAISTADQTATRPGAHYQAFSLNGLYLQTI